MTGLSFRPVDASYSLALDRIILISANPNQLHIYDPATNRDQVIGLSDAPVSLSLSPDGKNAAVGFASAVIYADLQNPGITNSFPNIAAGRGKVICGSGYIYVFPSYNGSLVSINIASGQATTTQPYTYASGGTFDAAVNTIYSTENGISPNSIKRFDTSAGLVGPSTSERTEYFDNYRVCGPLWLSHDGSVIYSACGAVYRASNEATEDMIYLGTLPVGNSNAGFSASLATSDALAQIATITAVPSYASQSNKNDDTVVNLYASSSLNRIGSFATTPFVVNSNRFPAHGRWVFYNSSSSAMFIITQADSSAGLLQDYAIENVNLTNANSCNATFGTATEQVAASGSYATVQVLSGQDCTYTAVSNVPWITLASGYYGSGNTTLMYLVRPNLSGSSRSGTISIGMETFTIVQDGERPASRLTPLSFKPVAATYDNALDKIVMVSASPNELHIYDPISQADQVVPLTYTPLSLSVRPDGLFAAVGHSGEVSIVDLHALTVSQIFSVDLDAVGIVLASNGYAYTFPGGVNPLATSKSIQLSTGTVNPSAGAYYGNIPRLDASGKYIYLVGGGKLDISNGPATLTNNFLNGFYRNIWLSQDGNRLFDSSGKVFFTSSVVAHELEADGQLSGASNVDWLADSQIQQQIAALVEL